MMLLRGNKILWPGAASPTAPWFLARPVAELGDRIALFHGTPLV
jgi:hypothetical protein